MGRGRGRLAVGGGRGAAGSRPAPPPTPRGEPGGAGPGPGEPGVRGHAGAVALPRVRSPLPPRISFSGGRATRRELRARTGALRFPPLRLGRPGGAGPGLRRACSMYTLRGWPAGARAGHGGGRAGVSAHAPRRPSPPPPAPRPGIASSHPRPPAERRWALFASGGHGVGPVGSVPP